MPLLWRRIPSSTIAGRPVSAQGRNGSRNNAVRSRPLRLRSLSLSPAMIATRRCRRASGRLLNLYAGRNDRVRACHSQRLPCPSRDGNRAVDRLPFEYRESPERTTIAYVSFCRVSRSLRGGPPIAGGCTGASRFPTHFAERVRRASRCTLRRGLATAYRAGLGRRSRSERKQRYATSPPGFVRRPRMGRFWSAAASLARLKRWQGWRTSETWS